MILIVAEHTTELEKICADHHVSRLELFGSAATGKYKPGESDMDFLVEFKPIPTGSYPNAYFGLMESLEELFGCPIDLVVGSSIKNPYFRQSVDANKVQVYEA